MMRTLMGLPKNEVALQHDCWYLKKLFSYGCRKGGFEKAKSPTRRAS